MNVSQSVGKWYDLNKRNLPWREIKNPYHIWISEIILQQTRMSQGMNYYHKFIQGFPTIFDLASSPVEAVLNIWQGLGYYSRARNMHKAANIIVNRYDGAFPTSVQELRQLPGIGEYSAAAIASLAFNIPVASIDRVRESDNAFLEVEGVPSADFLSARLVLLLPAWSPGESRENPPATGVN